MDNDIDLLETNRFIKLDIVDSDVSFLNTNDRYLDFLKKTEKHLDIDDTIENELLAIDDNPVDDTDGDFGGTTIEHPQTQMSMSPAMNSFSHEIDTVFSIDSRFRDLTSYPNAYSTQIFLEKEFGFLDLIEMLDIHIPHVSNVSGMNETNASNQPVPYLFMNMKIESFPDNVLNTIITPTISNTSNRALGANFIEQRDNSVSIFAKIGLDIRQDGAKIYNRIIYGSKNFNDTLSVVKAASAIRVEILGMNGKVLSSEVDSGGVALNPPFNNNNGNNWNMTIRFVEKVQLLKSLNVNSVRSLRVDPRATQF